MKNPKAFLQAIHHICMLFEMKKKSPRYHVDIENPLIMNE